MVKEESGRALNVAARRVGQVVLAPDRVVEKLPTKVSRRFRWKKRMGVRCAEPTEYQKGFVKHRASTEELASMRHEVRALASQPLISVLTPVFDTPVPWLREAVESVLAQVYENWELLLLDDGSPAADMLHALPALAACDRPLRLVRL